MGSGRLGDEYKRGSLCLGGACWTVERRRLLVENWPVTSSPNQQAEPLASPTRPSQAQRTAVSSTATTPQTHDRAPHQHRKPHRIGKHPNAKQRRLQACQLLQTTTVRDPTCSPHSTFTPYLAIPPGSTLPPSLPTASRFPMSFPGHNSKIQEEDCWRP